MAGRDRARGRVSAAWCCSAARRRAAAHPARDWLAFLARTATGDVAAPAGTAGYLTRAAAGLPGGGQRWVPVDPDCAFAPVPRVRSALDARPGGRRRGTVLAGLAVACGLGSRLLPVPARAGRRHLDEAPASSIPDLRELIAQTQAAVDSAVLSHRV